MATSGSFGHRQLGARASITWTCARVANWHARAALDFDVLRLSYFKPYEFQCFLAPIAA